MVDVELTKALSIHNGVRVRVAVEWLDDVDLDAQAITAAHQYGHPQCVAIVDQRVPVSTHTRLTPQAERPLSIAAGAWFNLKACGLSGQFEKFEIAFVYFGHRHSLAAISRQ
ncbi:hypothetical protein [Pseudomonas sp. EZ-C24]|uniref:hypothetical protein n=1 Tax=Pseudomonas sp. EZ-C24 TaxID=2753617 RepID=UPI00165E148E|nr:hypothetical protein [Pseudomonas sp. EZ-C24]